MRNYLDQELGNYRLLRLLGSGGFADVYLGEHLHLGTQAAVKVHHARVEGADLERFTQEARTIARLAHPHIVHVLDYGVQDGVAFLVMEYAPQGTLRDQHPSGMPVSLETVVEYVRQIASALQYAHNQKLVHRDVKPENMLLDARSQVLLSDFGLAVPVHSTRSLDTQDAIGTVAYMAPEQLQKKARPASDQYALAAIAYEWLCGAPPFEGLPIEVALQHITEPVPLLLEKRPDLPFVVERVLQRALAKEPEQRFLRVQAFAEALERAARRASGEARPFPEGPNERRGSNISLPLLLPAQRGRDPRPVFWETRSKMAFIFFAVALVLGSGLVGAIVALHHPASAQSSASTQLPTSSAPIGVLPGDWAEPNFDAQNSSNNIYEHTLNVDNIARLHELWHVYTLAGPSYEASFALAGNVAYWVNNRAPVAVNTLTGQQLWPDLPGVSGCSAPALADGHIYVTDQSGTLTILDMRTGMRISQLQFSLTMGGFCPAPIVASGIVYGTSPYNVVYAVDGRTGKQLWQTSLSDVTSTPAFAHGVVYVGGSRHVYALNASNGNLLWQTAALGTGGNMYNNGVDVGFFTPSVGTQFVYAITRELVLAFPLLCSNPCQPAWTLTDHDGFRAGPSFANGVVYAMTGYDPGQNGPLYALDGRTGRVLWQAPTPPAIFPPVIANGVVYQSDFYGNIYAFAARGCGAPTCKPIWNLSAMEGGDDGSYSVRVVDGRLYVLTVNGHFLAYGL